MAVILKNRNYTRCEWGCCGDVATSGKKRVRRAIRRRDRQQLKKENDQ